VNVVGDYELKLHVMTDESQDCSNALKKMQFSQATSYILFFGMFVCGLESIA
jgi:chlorite dismutase